MGFCHVLHSPPTEGTPQMTSSFFRLFQIDKSTLPEWEKGFYNRFLYIRALLENVNSHPSTPRLTQGAGEQPRARAGRLARLSEACCRRPTGLEDAARPKTWSCAELAEARQVAGKAQEQLQLGRGRGYSQSNLLSITHTHLPQGRREAVKESLSSSLFSPTASHLPLLPI